MASRGQRCRKHAPDTVIFVDDRGRDCESRKKRSSTAPTPLLYALCKRRPRRPRRRPPALSWARALRPDETRGQQMRPSTGRPRRARYEGHHCRRVEWATTDGLVRSSTAAHPPRRQGKQMQMQRPKTHARDPRQGEHIHTHAEAGASASARARARAKEGERRV